MLKKLILFFFLFLISTPLVFSNEDNIQNEDICNIYQAVYDLNTQSWTTDETIDDNKIVLSKKTFEGASSYSQLFYPDEKLALTLTSDFEFIKDGMLVGVDNNNLKFNQIIFNGEYFEEIPMTVQEVQKLFPDLEIIQLSLIDSDHKMWLSKPFFKKKDFLFINDSNKSYYKLTPRMKSLQQSEIKGIITIPFFGFFTLDHYGEYKGKIRIYVR